MPCDLIAADYPWEAALPVLHLPIRSWLVCFRRRTERQTTVFHLSTRRRSVWFSETICVNVAKSTYIIKFHKPRLLGECEVSLAWPINSQLRWHQEYDWYEHQMVIKKLMHEWLVHSSIHGLHARTRLLPGCTSLCKDCNQLARPSHPYTTLQRCSLASIRVIQTSWNSTVHPNATLPIVIYLHLSPCNI